MRIYGMHLYNRGEPNQPTLKPSAGRREQERDLAARRAAATLGCYGAAAGGRATLGWDWWVRGSGLEEEEELGEQRYRRLAVGEMEDVS